MNLLLLFLCTLSICAVSSCPAGYSQTSMGGCVKLVTQKLNWQSAEQYCKKQGGDLTSIHNAFDVGLLNELAASTNCRSYYSGGACANSHCNWTDGSPFDYQLWDIGYPTPSGYVSIDNDFRNGLWRTVSGTDQECFVCERKAVKEKKDCMDWKNAGSTQDGLYDITLAGVGYQVYCDMNTDGGGWTVIQRRNDGSEVFWNRKWSDYKYGFGNSCLGQNFWAGNELIHQLTLKDSNVSLRIEMHDDGTPNSKYSKAFWWNNYYEFKVTEESDEYRLHLALTWNNVQGNASTGWYDITYSSGAPFSTVDYIHDPTTDCVTKYQMGGWWLHNCALATLNGAYTPLDWSTGYGLFWIVDGGDTVIHPRKTKMMLRVVSN